MVEINLAKQKSEHADKDLPPRGEDGAASKDRKVGESRPDDERTTEE